MRGLAILLAASAAVLIAMCAESGSGRDQPPALDIRTVAAAVDSGNARWMRAVLAGDVDSMLSVYEEDPRSLSSSGTVTIGRDTLRSRLRGFYAGYEILDVFLETQHLWLEEVDAWEKGIYGMVLVTPDGDTAAFQEQYLARWQYQPDGTWKTHMTMTFPFAEPADWPN